MTEIETKALPDQMAVEDASDAPFQTFTSAEAPNLEESGAIKFDAIPADVMASLRGMGEAAQDRGAETRYLFGGGGVSLTHAWFKSGFPVVLHSHDCACLYYITAGSIQLGTKSLGKGDGFFVPKNVRYTYVAGSEGVEILEFRDAETFDIRMATSSKVYWDKATATVATQSAHWKDQIRPSDRIPVA